MTRLTSSVGLFILCMTVIFLTEGSCQAAPKVKLDQTVYDAGTVSEGKDVTHEFIFRNVGDKDLIIKPKPC